MSFNLSSVIETLDCFDSVTGCSFHASPCLQLRQGMPHVCGFEAFNLAPSLIGDCTTLSQGRACDAVAVNVRTIILPPGVRIDLLETTLN